MPHHIHTPPHCGFWTGHDPACFEQQFGAEVECILIEVGKNKGKYMCIHKHPPHTGSGRGGFEAMAPHERPFSLEPVDIAEYLEIRSELTADVPRTG